MQKLILIALLVIGCAAGIYLYTNQQPAPPPDYALMAQSALTDCAAASTDDDKLTAIINATSTFAGIIREIDDPAEASLAYTPLTQLADEAKRLDDELKQDRDARRALMKSRQPEVDIAAMDMAGVMLSTALRVKIMKEILDPVETMASTLQR